VEAFVRISLVKVDPLASLNNEPDQRWSATPTLLSIGIANLSRCRRQSRRDTTLSCHFLNNVPVDVVAFGAHLTLK
jgi:hypothetical protein